MSELRNLNNWKHMPEAIRGFQYEDWMGLAKSVSNMMYHFNGKLVDLSIENFAYNVKTKTSWILNKAEVEDDGDPIKRRWYPVRVQESPDDMVYFTEEIGARVVLEFMYGKSVFFHEDVETYKNNVRCMIRTAGTPAPKDRKAAWMLMFTAFAGHLLQHGQNYLENLERKEGRDPDEVIATWEDKDQDWGPDNDSVWRQPPVKDACEHDSINSPQCDTGSNEPTPEPNDADDLAQGRGQQELMAGTQ